MKLGVNKQNNTITPVQFVLYNKKSVILNNIALNKIEQYLYKMYVPCVSTQKYSTAFLDTASLISAQNAAMTSIFKNTRHTASTFGRTIFPGVWDASVMRHGSQTSDEIEDDLYQYNIE